MQGLWVLRLRGRGSGSKIQDVGVEFAAKGSHNA